LYYSHVFNGLLFYKEYFQLCFAREVDFAGKENRKLRCRLYANASGSGGRNNSNDLNCRISSACSGSEVSGIERRGVREAENAFYRSRSGLNGFRNSGTTSRVNGSDKVTAIKEVRVENISDGRQTNVRRRGRR